MGNIIELVMIPFFMACPIILLICIPIVIVRGLRQRKSLQFSLKSLLMFVTMFAVWISQFTRPPIVKPRETFELSHDFVVIFVWVLLMAFYLYRRVRFPLVIHCTSVALVGLLLVLEQSDGEYRSYDEVGWLICVGCFFGSTISFPTWMLMLWGFMRRSESKVSENDPQRHQISQENTDDT